MFNSDTSTILSSQDAAAIVVAISSTLSSLKQSRWEYQSGKCLFKLRRCQIHAAAIRSAYYKIEEIPPEEFSARIGVLKGEPIENRFYSYYVGNLSPIVFFNVDAFFESAKSCADFSIDMLGSAGMLKNPTNSMNKFVKKINYHKKNSSVELMDRIENYWGQCGSYVKSYRDCFTHFAALAGDHWQTAINIKCETGVTYARYFLPDNPNVNSLAKFTFDKHVDARELILEAVEKTEAYVRDILFMAAKNAGIQDGLKIRVPQTYRNVKVGTW